MSFPCTKCGACCRRASQLKEFPKELIVEGQCKHFLDNHCLIYDTRPEICRIDSNHMGMGTPEYYQLTALICNLWACEDGLGEQIDVEQFKRKS